MLRINKYYHILFELIKGIKIIYLPTNSNVGILFFMSLANV